MPKFNTKALGDWIQIAASVFVIGGFALFVVFAIVAQLIGSEADGPAADAVEGGGNHQPAIAVAVTPAQQSQLRDYVADNCPACHGTQLTDGSIGPPLSQTHLEPLSISAVALVILHGRIEKGMPAWQTELSPADAYWIADFLKRDGLHGYMP